MILGGGRQHVGPERKPQKVDTEAARARRRFSGKDVRVARRAPEQPGFGRRYVGVLREIAAPRRARPRPRARLRRFPLRRAPCARGEHGRARKTSGMRDCGAETPRRSRMCRTGVRQISCPCAPRGKLRARADCTGIFVAIPFRAFRPALSRGEPPPSRKRVDRQTEAPRQPLPCTESEAEPERFRAIVPEQTGWT